MSFESWVEQRMESLRKCAGEYAQAKAKVEHISEFKKSKLAMLMKKAESEGHKTAAIQEREARADREYVELINGLVEAVETAEKLRWELEIAKLGVEVWRTQQANERVERRGYGA